MGGRNGEGLREWLRVYWCPTRFPFQIMFVSSNSNTTVSHVEQELLTVHKFIPVFSGVRLARLAVYFVGSTT